MKSKHKSRSKWQWMFQPKYPKFWKPRKEERQSQGWLLHRSVFVLHVWFTKELELFQKPKPISSSAQLHTKHTKSDCIKNCLRSTQPYNCIVWTDLFNWIIWKFNLVESCDERKFAEQPDYDERGETIARTQSANRWEKGIWACRESENVARSFFLNLLIPTRCQASHWEY